MRILGFNKKWDKLNNIEFTTFRFPRKDKDWQAGEVVQIVVQPRRKGGGDKLGNARILEKEQKWIVNWFSGECGVSEDEAQTDGFLNRYDMLHWLEKTYGTRHYYNTMNILLLRWVR